MEKLQVNFFDLSARKVATERESLWNSLELQVYFTCLSTCSSLCMLKNSRPIA